MPKTKRRDVLEEVLSGLGLGDNWLFLIDRAIRGNWSPVEFTTALKNSPRFRRMFPGLVERDGQLAAFLGTSDLGAAVSRYRQLADQYERVAFNLAPGIKLSNKRIGLLIRSSVSPDELGARLFAIDQVRANPGLREAFNEQLRLAGKKPLDEIGFFKFLAGASSRNLYDFYEAALLTSSGLSISAEEAREVAKQTGPPGALNTDLPGMIQEIFKLYPDIGPELVAQGISDADILKAQTGQDPGGKIRHAIETLVANRRAKGRTVVGTPARRTPAGGIAMFPEEEEQSF